MTKPHLLTAACFASLSIGFASPASASFSETGEATAAQAQSDVLEALGLQANPAINWAQSQVRGDTYSFSGFTQTGEGFVVSADTLVIDGLRQGANGPVFDSIEYTDGQVTGEGGVMAGFDRIFMAGPSEALVAAVATGFRGQTEQIDANPLLETLDEVARQVRIEGFRMSMIDPTAPESTIAFELAEAVFDDADGDGLADMDLSNFSMQFTDAATETPVLFNIERMSGMGVVSASLFNGLDPQSFDPALALSKTYDSFEMSNMLMSFGGTELAMPTATSRMQELGNGALRTTFEMPNLSLTVDPGAGPEAAEVAGGLAMLGYERLDMSYTSSYVYDPAQDRLYSDGPNAFTLNDGGIFDVRFDMAGLTKYMESAMAFQATAIEATEKATPEAMDEAAAMEMMSALKFNSLSMSFEDAGLLERGLGLFAMQSGVDVETARMQAAGMVSLLAMGAGEALPPAVLAQMSQAAMGFIQNGGTIEVALQPGSTVSFMDFITPEGGFDAEAAGLSFSHEAP